MRIILKNKKDIDWISFSINNHPEAIPLLEANLKKIDWMMFSRNISEYAINIWEKNLEKIQWIWMSMNPSKGAMKLIKQNLKKVILKNLYLNSNSDAFQLLLELLLENSKEIDVDILSSNTCPLAIKYLEEHLDGADWRALSRNAAAMHILQKNPKKIVWSEYSKNPAAIHDLEKNTIKVYIKDILSNPSVLDIDYKKMAEVRTRVIFEDLMKKSLHPTKIQKYVDAGLEPDGSVKYCCDDDM